MILEKVLDHYENPDNEEMARRRRPGHGNPTGSSFGKCAAQMVLHRYPDLGQPEPYRTRTVINFEEGDRIETWLKDTFAKILPGLVGSAQGLTYFDVDLTDEEVDEIRTMIRAGWGSATRLWGTVIENFKGNRPRINPETGRLTAAVMNPKWGFVLDPVGKKLWAPIFIDFAVKLEDLGHAVVEIKSVSDGTYRRALLGELDASKKAQAAGIVAATGLPFVMLMYRKMTGHLLEIAYLPAGQEDVRVRIMRLNRVVDEYRVPVGTETVLTVDGKRTALPHDQDYEIAEVWTPHDPRLLDEIRQRIKTVLFWRPGKPLPREAGPSFVCEKCGGLGERTCGQCHGTGKTAKLGKPCGPCGGKRTVTCDKCTQGLLDEAPLPPMPCSYCGVKEACYGAPLAATGIEEAFRLEVAENRAPKWVVKRAAWEKAGLSYVIPPSHRRGEPAPAPAPVEALPEQPALVEP